MGIQTIGKDIIIEQIKSMIAGGISRFAKQASENGEKVDKKRIALWIYAEDNSGYPKLKVLKDLKTWKTDVSFGDLANTFEKMTYLTLSFNVEKDTPEWIQKFILKSAKDMGLEVTVAKYLIGIFDDDELHAVMYVNNKQIKEIEMDYIIGTS